MASANDGHRGVASAKDGHRGVASQMMDIGAWHQQTMDIGVWHQQMMDIGVWHQPQHIIWCSNQLYYNNSDNSDDATTPVPMYHSSCTHAQMIPLPHLITDDATLPVLMHYALMTSLPFTHALIPLPQCL